MRNTKHKMVGLLIWFVHSHKHTQYSHIFLQQSVNIFRVFMDLVRESLHVTVSANTAAVQKAVTRELDEVPLL